MSRSLVVVRHGRTDANARGVLLGRANPSLDELGRRQADALAAVLCSGRFGTVGAVVSSPLERTLQTAARTADALGLPVQVDERLIELDYGEYEGLPVSGLPAETWQEWQADVDFRPPGGESLAELGRRVRECCQEWAGTGAAPAASTGVAGDRTDETVVLVSHVSPIKAVAAWALGVDDRLAWRTHLDPASITRILLRGDRPVLSLFNETAHLG